MSKLLDNNGLTHLWTKLKEYLASWKSTNFGTGTYSNHGSIQLSAGDIIQIASNCIRIDSEIENIMEYSLRITDTSVLTISSEVNNMSTLVHIGHTDSKGRVRIYGNDLCTIKYLIIGENGVKKGTVAIGVNTFVENVGSTNSPFICITATHNY